MALTKSKKHYVGLTWTDGEKNDYRGVLAGLEGVTGKKAVIGCDDREELKADSSIPLVRLPFRCIGG